MGQFLSIVWPPRAPEPSTVGFLREAAEREGWGTLWTGPGLWICGGGPRPPRLAREQDGRVLVIGDLFARAPGRSPSPGACLVERCRRLSETHWGRYVALALDREGAPEALFRDPSGALDCVIWRWGALVFAASAAPPWLVRALSLSWSVDWERVADTLADPLLITADPPLRKVEALAPGEVRALHGGEAGVPVWTPARAARQTRGRRGPAQARLRSAVDAVVGSYARGAAGLLVEISGGLDSAIVASAVRAAGPAAPTVLWHFWGPYPESDERRYARALAERLAVAVEMVERPEPSGPEAFRLEQPPAFRPTLGRIDAAYDALQADVCRSRGLDAVLTGKGGDAALFQLATSAVVADLWARKGPLALGDATSLVLARRLRRSVWSVLCRGLRAGGRPLRRRPCALAAPEVRLRRPPPHPWLRDLRGLPLGKRLQIAGFVHHLSMHGGSLRAEAADLLHPFLSQPVMEACLATPTPVLTLGGHDRMLGRRAFADRLPETILRRRSKGELGAYFARSVIAAADPLRTHLLEGRLAAAGLLDRRAVESALEPDHLVVAGFSPDITLLAALEGWAQAWDGEPPPWRR